MKTELVIYGWAKYVDLQGRTCLRRFVVKHVYELSLTEARQWKEANEGQDVELLYRTEERL